MTNLKEPYINALIYHYVNSLSKVPIHPKSLIMNIHKALEPLTNGYEVSYLMKDTYCDWISTEGIKLGKYIFTNNELSHDKINRIKELLTHSASRVIPNALLCYIQSYKHISIIKSKLRHAFKDSPRIKTKSYYPKKVIDKGLFIKCLIHNPKHLIYHCEAEPDFTRDRGGGLTGYLLESYPHSRVLFNSYYDQTNYVLGTSIP
ncbi:hypothetical protein A3Q56_06144 [Intoshia linei]|uniref:Uncharacterized protein n=1 Tax=Intoshia linei TaxID=1819745 RepID=A0A177AVV1_9BILA|nr:hypothetical protein A3Q56_06144 [Intoshia linei]